MKKLLRLLPFLPALAAAEVTCDNLRNNPDAYDRCVREWYGRDNRQGGSTLIQDYNARWARELEYQQQQDAAREAAWAAARARAQAEEARRAAEEAERAAAAAAWQRGVESDRDAAARAQGDEVLLRDAVRRRQAALAAQLAGKPALAPADFASVIAAGYPYWDLMHPWAERAAREQGGRFRLVLAMVDRQGCAAEDRFDQALLGIRGRRHSSACEEARGRAVEAAHEAMRDASRFDRLMTCAQDLAWQKAYWEPLGPTDEGRRRRAATDACYSRLTGIPQAEVDAFMAEATKRHPDGNVSSDLLVFLDPASEHVDTADAAAVARMVRTARWREALQLRLHSPRLLAARQRDAAADGIAVTAPALPAPPVLGPVVVRELNLGRAPGTPAFVAEPGADEALPAREWEIWGRAWYAMNDEAVSDREQGQHARALRQAGLALALAQQAGGRSDPLATDSLVELARNFALQGRGAEADAAYRRAVALRDEAGDRDSPGLRQALTLYGAFLHQQGRVEEGVAVDRRALPLLESRYGKGSSEADAVRLRLAGALLGRRQYAEAEALFAAAADSMLERESTSTAARAGALEGWGEALAAQGKREAAADKLQRAGRVYWRALFPENAARPAALERIAALFAREGLPNAEAAQAQAAQARARYERLQRDGAPARRHASPDAALSALAKQADALMVAGKFDEAIPVARELMAVAEEMGLAYEVRGARDALGRSLFQAGRYREAEPVLMAGVEAARAELKGARPDMKATYATLLGHQLQWAVANARAQKRLRQADPLHWEMYQAYREASGAESRVALQALLDYARLQVEAKQDKAASEWYFEVLDRAAAPGKEDRDDLARAVREELPAVLERRGMAFAAAALREKRAVPYWERAWEEAYAEARDPGGLEDDEREEKVELARDALQQARKNAPANHRFIAFSQYRLGALLLKGNAAEVAEGEALVTQALATAVAGSGAASAEADELRGNLALHYLYDSPQRPEQAAALYGERAELLAKRDGKHAESVARALDAQGQALQRAGRFKEGARVMERAIDVYEEAQGEFGAGVYGALQRLRGLYEAQGDAGEAKDIAERIEGKRRQEEKQRAAAAEKQRKAEEVAAREAAERKAREAKEYEEKWQREAREKWKREVEAPLKVLRKYQK